MKTDPKTLHLADRMLAGMGLSPVTVPEVLNGNRVPDKDTAERYRKIEYLLLKNRWVNNVRPPAGQTLPGGWKLLQISNAGYKMVQDGETPSACLETYQTLDYGSNLTYNSGSTARPRDWVDSENETEEPLWWRTSHASTLKITYDAEQEWPVWWAKYRIRRMWDLFPNDDKFPVTWWEKKVDYLFRRRKDIIVLIISSLVGVGILYAFYLILSSTA